MLTGTSFAIVIVDFEVDAESVFLVIKNGGQAPAISLKIKPSGPIIGLNGKRDISELSIFKKIGYLAPLKEIRIFVDSYISFFLHLRATRMRFSISYKDDNGKSFKKKIVHELNIYTDLIYFIKKD